MSQRMENYDAFVLQLLDEVPAAVFCKDAEDDYRFVFWNRHAENIYKLKREQVVGNTDRDLFPSDQTEFFRHKDEETMREGKTVIIPEEELHTPGGNFWLRTRKVPLFLENPRRRYLLGISEDITEDRALRMELDSQRRITADMRTLAALGEMAGNVAHEVNSPLNALLIQLYLFRQKVGDAETLPAPKEVNEFLDTMGRVTNKIMEVTKALYTYASYSRRSYAEWISLDAIAQDAVVLNREKMRLASIEIRLVLAAGTSGVKVRPMEVLQTVMHLLNMAAEVNEEGKPRWIEVRSLADDSFAELEVRSSVPWPAPSFRVGGKFSTAQKIAESYGGSLAFDEPNNTFRFRLPVSRL